MPSNGINRRKLEEKSQSDDSEDYTGEESIEEKVINYLEEY